MQDFITCQIETIEYDELLCYMRCQADDAFPTLKDEQWLQTFTKKLHANAEFCLCRDHQGQLVGMVAFYANGAGGNFAYIPHVFVNSKYRKKKLFKRMLDITKAKVKEAGFDSIKLHVSKKRSIALQSYQNVGFVVIAEDFQGRVLMNLSI